jgi:hypothetical protein
MAKNPPGRGPNHKPSRSALWERFRREPEYRVGLEVADIVFGVDIRDPRHKALFYGRVLLERIVKTNEEREAIVIEVPIDFDADSDDVESLAAFCFRVKGSCCYRAHGEPRDTPDRINPSFN